MASLRKAAPSRTYQERHQPHARERFGLLEKHKDYVLRARDFHKKQDELQRLRVKAALRNPDEFYHHMTRSRTTVRASVGCCCVLACRPAKLGGT